MIAFSGVLTSVNVGEKLGLHPARLFQLEILLAAAVARISLSSVTSRAAAPPCRIRFAAWNVLALYDRTVSEPSRVRAVSSSWSPCLRSTPDDPRLGAARVG